MSKIWFITGANRGFGYEIARAALESGDTVVATARRPAQAQAALNAHSERVLALPLDVTDPASIDAAVAAATDRFGRIDVLVNNAGYGQLGYFEEQSPESIERQFATNVFGVFNVSRAVLPVMRAQRSGHVINISSLSGIIGIAGSPIYGATKFAVTGWSEGLGREVAPFGIHVTCVHPGMFRTDFLDPSSVSHGDVEIDDYASFRTQQHAYLEASNHTQLGDPARFGPAIVRLAALETPPERWASGSDALASFAQRAEELTGSAAEWENLSRSTDIPQD
ncbi:oxidoreductase [Actinacidiphila acididurans]|uniref:SDR family NAD(P)-dependent oxidoreductase n=1 Tax=Actinacidiphila acididurans TaxID=2784346 RepID=A0ABS2TI55_9ACTN|nr:oxidoreductase [Actinacidiphila acididurans]MBM9503025.1 SDR family NAD(P)-dependent oxidoreductase [Actinacidiphila acididurans]